LNPVFNPSRRRVDASARFRFCARVAWGRGRD